MIRNAISHIATTHIINKRVLVWSIGSSTLARMLHGTSRWWGWVRCAIHYCKGHLFFTRNRTNSSFRNGFAIGITRSVTRGCAVAIGCSSWGRAGLCGPHDAVGIQAGTFNLIIVYVAAIDHCFNHSEV